MSLFIIHKLLSVPVLPSYLNSFVFIHSTQTAAITEENTTKGIAKDDYGANSGISKSSMDSLLWPVVMWACSVDESTKERLTMSMPDTLWWTH